MSHLRVALLTLAAFCLAVTLAAAGEIPAETYTLPNGLTVILHRDASLPRVAVNLWYRVGSGDEKPGRTGFAHLFEHLMFMGTTRVPRGEFDKVMESGGGANNASTSTDRTNYFSWGPSSLLPTLLWLDADRMEGLGAAMTKEKVDLQCSVVRNERRQVLEDRPYGVVDEIVPAELWPEGHPYHHPIIGSHQDLEAATFEDVKQFFATYYVPGNASLVVAGSFDAAEVKKLVAQTFGAVPARAIPDRLPVPAVTLDHEIRRLVTDRVSFPKLYLVWIAPSAYAEGDAEVDLLSRVLADGATGRLYERLVVDEPLAQEIEVYVDARELGSELRVEVTAAGDVDLEKVKRVVLEVLAELKANGPTDAELRRAKAALRAEMLEAVEDLDRRADMLNEYYAAYGEPASFERDLKRRTAPDASAVTAWARKVLGEGRLDVRVLPDGATVEGASLDKAPESWPAETVRVPAPLRFTLGNGIPVDVVQRPASGLFSGFVLVDGGERVVPPDKSGLASLTATLLTSGADNLDAVAFAEAVAEQGAVIEASASWQQIAVSFSGLAANLEPTLALVSSALLRPTMAEADVLREKGLVVDAIKARGEEPTEAAVIAGQALLFGRDDPRGRPVDGYLDSVQALGRQDLVTWLPRLLDPGAARIIVVGDVNPGELERVLDERFGSWAASGERPPALPAPVTAVASPRIALVDRPGAEQTTIVLLRPLPVADAALRPARECVANLFGVSFTSRLMQSIREDHGYSYGVHMNLLEEGSQAVTFIFTPVETAVTGAALTALKSEFDSLASGDVTEEELTKARRQVQSDIVSSLSTSRSLARLFATLAASGRSPDDLQRELEALPQLKLEAANAEARSGLYDWKGLLILLVGDRAAVEPQLTAAGFPAPEVVDVEGIPVK